MASSLFAKHLGLHLAFPIRYIREPRSNIDDAYVDVQPPNNYEIEPVDAPLNVWRSGFGRVATGCVLAVQYGPYECGE